MLSVAKSISLSASLPITKLAFFNDVTVVSEASKAAVSVVLLALVVIPFPPAIVRSTFPSVSEALPESPDKVTPVISPVASEVPRETNSLPL